MSIERLGILGGTFDPIHYGHLAIAEEAAEVFALDRVLFIPAGMPPHKRGERAGAAHRLRMVELAIAGNARFALSRVEIDRPGPSYTADTLRLLRADYPAAAFYLIMGADMALEFHAWRDPDGILAQAQVIAATRPGFDLAGLAALPTAGRFHLMDAPGLYISSTDLRARLRAGRGIRYLLPEAVAEYIRRERLYSA